VQALRHKNAYLTVNGKPYFKRVAAVNLFESLPQYIFLAVVTTTILSLVAGVVSNWCKKVTWNRRGAILFLIQLILLAATAAVLLSQLLTCPR
jgi:hypothetical protein